MVENRASLQLRSRPPELEPGCSQVV
uniref:Uncharacterized protein n=1 Tax=Arundo donax TaxID=35708 RepID=A0A0A9AD08_ARUDO